jgi:hypothetical protein
MTTRLPGALLACLLASAAIANAQTVTLRGGVDDAATERPVFGAVVTLRGQDVERSTRTDEAGAWHFTFVRTGRYTVTARRLGFEPATTTIEVGTTDTSIVLRLARIATLDTLRVRAARQGIFGVIAAAHSLRPLPNGSIRVIGLGSMTIAIDSGGQFFAPIRNPGNFLLRAKAPGFLPLTLSVSVERNDGAEVAFLLDSAIAGQGASHRLETAFLEFEERLHRRRLMSALVPRTDLLRFGDDTRLVDAIRTSRSLVTKTLRFTATACVFVDGVPRPGLSLNAVDTRDVEAVEVYSRTGEASATLSQRWPGMGECGDTGMPRVSPGSDVIYWVSVWLKR